MAGLVEMGRGVAFGLSSQQPTCPQVEALARIFDLRAAPPAPMSPPWLPDSQERHRQIDWRAIERDLRATLAHEVPPALNAVLHKLGVDDGTAKRRMPDLCGSLLCPRPPYRMAGDGARRRAALP